VQAESSEEYRRSIYGTYLSGSTRHPGWAGSQENYLQWALGARQRLRGWLPSDRTTPILDLGCGAGNVLFLLERLGYTDLTGVDMSPEQIALARKWSPNATIIEGDVREILRRYPGRFGLITGIDLLEHFRKDEIISLLGEILAALRPGGRVIIQTPNAGSPFMGTVVYGDFTHESCFTPISLAEMLGRAGLGDFEARPSGPVVHGLKSFIRWGIWRCVELLLRLWNVAETGSRGSGIYTRVFLAKADKPEMRV
jgi:SAM-dependent methyltransferase